MKDNKNIDEDINIDTQNLKFILEPCKIPDFVDIKILKEYVNKDLDGNKEYFDDLDITYKISEPRKAEWILSKAIKNSKLVGNGNANIDIIVTDKMKFCAKTIEMYKLPDNTIVSGYHYIKYKNKFILVRHHPERVRLYNYNEPFIYCINTSTKRIFINNNEYLDWEDKINNDNPFRIKGFNKHTQLTLYNGNKCSIQNIQIGDILSHGEKVFGLVETLDKTYHLFTDKKSFHINNIKVNHYDYD